MDLVLADDDFVRDEFDAIVAAGWGEPMDPGTPPDDGAAPDAEPSPVAPSGGPVIRRTRDPLVRHQQGRWPRSPPHRP
jgi:hypothetical protein